MSYKLIYSEDSLKQLKKLDKSVQKLIVRYLRNLETLEEPRAKEKLYLLI